MQGYLHKDDPCSCGKRDKEGNSKPSVTLFFICLEPTLLEVIAQSQEMLLQA